MELLVTPSPPSPPCLSVDPEERRAVNTNAASGHRCSSLLSSSFLDVLAPPPSAWKPRSRDAALRPRWTSTRLSTGQQPGDSPLQPYDDPIPSQLHTGGTSAVSCARKSTKQTPFAGPLAGIDGSLFSAASCGSSCGAYRHDCSPVAETVVSTVSGMRYDMKLLSEVVSRHEAVMAEIRAAITDLGGLKSLLQVTSASERCCGWCKCSRLRNLSESQGRPVRGQKPGNRHGSGKMHKARPETIRPVIDTMFSVDHIVGTTRRNKFRRLSPLPSPNAASAKRSAEVVDLTSDTVADSYPLGRDSKVQRLVYGGAGGHPRLEQPAIPDDVVNLGSLLRMKVERIPQIMNLVFRPTDAMNLSRHELAVATYIFSEDLPKGEILIDVGDCICSRGALLTLVPKCEVVDDVLNAVVRMLTTSAERHCWFLPTSLMQAAIDGRSMTSGNITSIRNKYMRSKVDRVSRIYQPMWCDQHWYLMIIDVPRRKLIYLDSLRDPNEADARKTGMLRVALYLEGVTLGKSWLSAEGALRPRFSAFDFEEPDIPQQERNSMDCGVWVAQWMIREHLWKDYGVQHVNSARRMRLAVDLVLKSHNEIAHEVVTKAFAHWETKST
ncbi:hypothetical protein AHAS_Ahas11G0163200 [Arachis hypogaea]